jgi:hypothetical protein
VSGEEGYEAEYFAHKHGIFAAGPRSDQGSRKQPREAERCGGEAPAEVSGRHSSDDKAFSSMLRELEQLAEDIAMLSRTGAQAKGTSDALMISQIIHHLRSALHDLCEREGMLTGPMPWWTQWQADAPD